MIKTDIDIDFADRNKALSLLSCIPAKIVNGDKETRHNSGVYFQDVPVDPLTGMSSIAYREAEDLGYFKIDFLNNSIYEGVRSPEHLEELVSREPEWTLLEDEQFVQLLAHVGNHFDVVNTIKPKSVTELAMVLALIRPAKRYLLNENRATIEAEIWTTPLDGSYHFKKSHSVSYALSIVVQMNLLVEQIMGEEAPLGLLP